MYNHQLDTFLCVADKKSFSAAAKDCFISPSAVIQQINALEKSIGVKLFIRTNHGLKLTPAGEILRKDAGKIIEIANASMEAMRRSTGSRPIRLGWTTGVEDSRFLSECLAFRDGNPGVTLEITRIAENVLHALAQNEIDFCEYMESPRFAAYGYDFTPLYSVRQCVVVPPEHPLAERQAVRLADLAGMTLAVLKKGVMTDHDRFIELVRRENVDVHLIEMEQYGFAEQTECFSKRYAFLGVEPLSHQYTPLRSIPVDWGIQTRIGLVSPKQTWADMEKLVACMRRTYSAG